MHKSRHAEKKAFAQQASDTLSQVYQNPEMRKMMMAQIEIEKEKPSEHSLVNKLAQASSNRQKAKAEKQQYAQTEHH